MGIDKLGMFMGVGRARQGQACMKYKRVDQTVNFRFIILDQVGWTENFNRSDI
jgi:hypothetical protein